MFTFRCHSLAGVGSTIIGVSEEWDVMVFRRSMQSNQCADAEKLVVVAIKSFLYRKEKEIVGSIRILNYIVIGIFCLQSGDTVPLRGTVSVMIRV